MYCCSGVAWVTGLQRDGEASHAVERHCTSGARVELAVHRILRANELALNHSHRNRDSGVYHYSTRG